MQVAKYAALFSDKGYAVGQKFRAWLEHRRAARAAGQEDAPAQAGDEGEAEGLADSSEVLGELLGDCEDLLAIKGSRNYIFYLNAAVVERMGQSGSFITFLQVYRYIHPYSLPLATYTLTLTHSL